MKTKTQKSKDNYSVDVEHMSGPDGCHPSCEACKQESNAYQQAKAQLESITEMVKALEQADASGVGRSVDDYEQAEQNIQDDALSVEVRTGWYAAGEANHKAE